MTGNYHLDNRHHGHRHNTIDQFHRPTTHHRHPENFVELERFPTSPHSNSPSHCKSLCIENTDHQTSQPTSITIATSQKEFCTSSFLRDEETFCSWGDVEGAS